MSILTRQISVLVVDDSAFMRKAISMMLEEDPGIKVVGYARNGEEAIDKVPELQPDIVTMDIEMPRMDGLTALSRIMEDSPTPVMMISSLTKDGAKATLDAFELGAVDFIPKQLSYASLDIVKIKQELIDKVKHIYSRRRTLLAQHALAKRQSHAASNTCGTVLHPAFRNGRASGHIKTVAIGVSTGGPPALQKIIPRLPKDFPSSLLVVQHMPPMFTRSLADRLDSMSAIKVKEAEQGEPVVSGCVYIAPGDKHLKIRRWGRNAEILVDDEPSDTLHKPSVDVLMEAVASTFGGAVVAVMLTGMGTDGAAGVEMLKSKGARVIAQNEQTCVVYGMPRAVVEKGLADKVSPIDSIAEDIVSFFT
jgi:two-component system chemotaxis response regulator CheB